MCMLQTSQMSLVQFHHQLSNYSMGGQCRNDLIFKEKKRPHHNPTPYLDKQGPGSKPGTQNTQIKSPVLALCCGGRGALEPGKGRNLLGGAMPCQSVCLLTDRHTAAASSPVCFFSQITPAQMRMTSDPSCPRKKHK